MAYPVYIRGKARRDLPIGTTENETLAARRAGNANRANHMRLREAAYQRGRAEYAGLLEQPTFRDFVCMYIGEGYRRDRSVVSICNSDPAVVRLAWMDAVRGEWP
jgi:hypothetical protein